MLVGLMVAGDHAPRFPVRLVEKDLRYAASLGDLPVVRAAQQAFARAQEAGLGAHNLSAIGLN